MKSKRDTVCFVTTSFPRYDGDFFGSCPYNFTKELSKRYKIVVVTHGLPKASNYEKIGGVDVFRFRWLYPKNFIALVHYSNWWFFRLITYLISGFFTSLYVVSKFRARYIQVFFTIPSGFIAILVGKILKKPVFVMPLGSDLREFITHPIFKHLVKYVLKEATCLMIGPDELKNYVLHNYGISEDKIYFVPNAIDTKRFDGMKRPLQDLNNDKNFKVLFLGRLVEFKNPTLFVRAMPKILQKNSDISFYIAGDGPLRTEVEKLVDELNIERNVKMLGTLDYALMPGLLSSVDVATFLSEIENFGTAMMESMSSERAIIATNVGCIDEAIDNNHSGILIDNNPESLAKAILKLVSNKEMCHTLGKNARKFIIDNHSIEKSCDKISEIYSSHSNSNH